MLFTVSQFLIVALSLDQIYKPHSASHEHYTARQEALWRMRVPLPSMMPLQLPVCQQNIFILLFAH